jgi:peptidoglycan/xylan/chitin deacetylase (PgdA/CDA1 family)
LAFAVLLLGTGLSSAYAADTCANPESALGVSRIVEIDAKTGPLFGEFTKHEKEPRFLDPKEVVLTFDDGPMPKYTKPILDALDKFCTKATFFSVGQMATAYPDMVKEVIGRGHTIGTHTWSHPMNLRAMSLEKAQDQVERGFAAVALAAGQPIAPFFRFPGLSDSGPLLEHLQRRGIAAFTVDVVSNDSYIGSPQRLASRTLDQIEKQNGGIVLFHDIKASTPALPHSHRA